MPKIQNIVAKGAARGICTIYHSQTPPSKTHLSYLPPLCAACCLTTDSNLGGPTWKKNQRRLGNLKNIYPGGLIKSSLRCMYSTRYSLRINFFRRVEYRVHGRLIFKLIRVIKSLNLPLPLGRGGLCVRRGRKKLRNFRRRRWHDS